MGTAKDFVQTIFNVGGYELRRLQSAPANFPIEFDEAEKEILARVLSEGLTMVSPERLWATAMACKHAIERNIPGDFVECGVWRGGNSIVAASLFKLHKQDRRVFLFDTFEGMTDPSAEDKVICSGEDAADGLDAHRESLRASLEHVQRNFADFGLTGDKIVFVKGDVTKTLDERVNLPEKISVLRLDTDWYDSTRKELEVLYPRLSIGGAIILDDYGFWAGSKQAVDEYFTKHGNRPFFQYTDAAGRAGVKYS